MLTGVAVALQGRWWDAKINFSREKFMKRSRAALKTHLASLRIGIHSSESVEEISAECDHRGGLLGDDAIDFSREKFMKSRLADRAALTKT